VVAAGPERVPTSPADPCGDAVYHSRVLYTKLFISGTRLVEWWPRSRASSQCFFVFSIRITRHTSTATSAEERAKNLHPPPEFSYTRLAKA
jgi:hypothetical protein